MMTTINMTGTYNTHRQKRRKTGARAREREIASETSIVRIESVTQKIKYKSMVFQHFIIVHLWHMNLWTDCIWFICLHTISWTTSTINSYISIQCCAMHIVFANKEFFLPFQPIQAVSFACFTTFNFLAFISTVLVLVVYVNLYLVENEKPRQFCRLNWWIIKYNEQYLEDQNWNFKSRQPQRR